MAERTGEMYIMCNADARIIFRIGKTGKVPAAYSDSAAPLFLGRSRAIFEDFCRGAAIGAEGCDIAVFPADPATSFVCAVCKRKKYFSRPVTEVLFLRRAVPDIQTTAEYASSAFDGDAFAKALPKDTRRRIAGLIFATDELCERQGGDTVFDAAAILSRIISKIKEHLPDGSAAIDSALFDTSVLCCADLPKFTAIAAMSAVTALRLSSDNSCHMTLVSIGDTVTPDTSFSPKKNIPISDGTLFELCSFAPSCAAEIAVLSSISDGAGLYGAVTHSPNGRMHICTSFSATTDPDALKYSDHAAEAEALTEEYIAEAEKYLFI